MNAVAQLYFCKYFIMHIPGTSKQRHYFVGRQSNVATCREMANYINKSIQKQANKEQREIGADSTWNRSFCKGAASQIARRCALLREEAEAANSSPSTGTAIVLASVYKTELEANQKLIEQEGHILRSSKSNTRNTDAHAFASGKAYGNSISLNRQLGGANSSNRQLLK